MKRLSTKQRLRHIRIIMKSQFKKNKKNAPKGNKKATKNSRRIFQKKPAIKSINELKNLHPETKIEEQKGKEIIVFAPKKMQLTNNKEAVFDFLRCVRDLTTMKKFYKRVEFSEIKSLSPLCAMLLAAELHRWQLIANQKLRVLDLNRLDSIVKKILSNIGLFDLVSVVNQPASDKEDIEEKFVRIFSARDVNIKQTIKHVEKKVKDIATMLNQDRELCGAIAEAAINVRHWAYKDYKFNDINEFNKIKDRWWFCVSYNVKSGRMTIMVYDHGKGIPATLLEAQWYEPIVKYLESINIKNFTDDKLLKAIMNLPERKSGKKHTASKKDYRGKGLRDIRRLLNNFNKGTFRIISRKGEYQFNCENKEEIIHLSKYSIAGTMLAWEIYPNNGVNI